MKVGAIYWGATYDDHLDRIDTLAKYFLISLDTLYNSFHMSPLSQNFNLGPECREPN